MKISVISTTAYHTPPIAYGGEVLVYDICEGLRKLGHEIILYGVKNPYVDYKFKVNPLLLTEGVIDWNAEFDAYRYYKQDLLNSDFIIDISHGKLIAQYLHNFHRKNNIINCLIGTFYAQPKPPFNIVTLSKKQLEIGNGKIPEDSRYVYPGTNTDFYSYQGDKEDYFIWFGRFHYDKGTDLAIRLAIETGENLVLIGSTKHFEHSFYARKYLQMIEGHDNIKYIELPDDETHQEQKKKLIQKAKGFLNPVRYEEAFGLVNIESLSCGTPVIAMNRGAIPEIIKHGETGFVCDNLEQMVVYMRMIDEIDTMECRRDCVERFSQFAVGKRFERVIREILDKQ